MIYGTSMIYDCILRDVVTTRETLRQQARVWNDDNAVRQAAAAVDRACKRLPKEPELGWENIYVFAHKGKLSVSTTLDQEASGCSYDWIISNCQWVNIRTSDDIRWVIEGPVEEEAQLAKATITVNAPVPEDVIDLLGKMGFFRIEPKKMVGGNSVFSCQT